MSKKTHSLVLAGCFVRFSKSVVSVCKFDFLEIRNVLSIFQSGAPRSNAHNELVKIWLKKIFFPCKNAFLCFVP